MSKNSNVTLLLKISCLCLLTCSAVCRAETNSGSGSAATTMSRSSTLSSTPNLSSTTNTKSSSPASNSNNDITSEQNALDLTLQNKVGGEDESLHKSEFQDFVIQSTGKKLPIYGHNFFTNPPSTFAPLKDVPVPSDYAIGPGDELIVKIWGQIESNVSIVVDRGGVVDIPKVGPVSVAGVRYQDLAQHLKSAVARVYRNFELDVSLGKLRSLQIYVVGRAKKPGSYTISSMSTLVNALIASGGPAANGSIRHVQLKRGSLTISEFDMYDLLLKGDKSKDVQLLDGDVIYIPPVGALAAITGSIGNAGIFELGKQDTLEDLLNFAGGLTNTASGKTVSVERIHERTVRKVDEFQLDKLGLAKPIQDADLITVYSISARFDNAITLRGNIAIPGRHPWHEGLRISDVIPTKETLITDTYWANQNQAAQLNAASDKGLRNEVKRVIEEVNWDYAVIERLNSKDLTAMLIPFELGKAVVEHDPAQNLLLEAGDVITIFSKNDIQVPAANRTKYVLLQGEFLHAGLYQIQSGETLSQLVRRIGGVTSSAYLFAGEFNRESTRQIQQKHLDELIASTEQAILRSSANSADTSISKDAAAAQAKAQAQSALLEKMKAIKATGRIVLEMPETQAKVDDIPNLILEDGDTFSVPAIPSTVSVMGNVYTQSAFIYKSSMSVGDYLAKSGGPTSNGNADEVYLLRADGTVFSKKQSGWLFGSFASLNSLPGDTIIVPEQLEKYSLKKDIMDWTTVFYQFALGVAGGRAARMW